MYKCSICGNEINATELTVFFNDKNDKKHYICEDCKRKLNNALSDENLDDVKALRENLKYILKDVTNSEIKNYIMDALNPYNQEELDHLEEDDEELKELEELEDLNIQDDYEEKSTNDLDILVGLDDLEEYDELEDYDNLDEYYESNNFFDLGKRFREKADKNKKQKILSNSNAIKSENMTDDFLRRDKQCCPSPGGSCPCNPCNPCEPDNPCEKPPFFNCCFLLYRCLAWFNFLIFVVVGILYSIKVAGYDYVWLNILITIIGSIVIGTFAFSVVMLLEVIACNTRPPKKKPIDPHY